MSLTHFEYQQFKKDEKPLNSKMFDLEFFRFRSENESLAISPVRNHLGLALYQDLSVLSESTTSRSTI